MNAAKKRYREKLIADGRCPRCTMRDSAPGKSYCQSCSDYTKEYQQFRRDRLKREREEQMTAKAKAKKKRSRKLVVGKRKGGRRVKG